MAMAWPHQRVRNSRLPAPTAYAMLHPRRGDGRPVVRKGQTVHMTSKVLVGIVGLACAALAQAQALKLRPGLWEMQMSTKSQSGQMEQAMAEMQKALADMPPAERKQMEQMMAQRGVGMTAGGGQKMRMCMTQEQVSRDEVPQQEGCTHTMQRLSANTIKTSFTCKGRPDEPASSGEGTITIESSSAYRVHNVVRMVQDGKPEQITMDQQGRWLGEDCGQIKPITPPAKR